jgi:hypothetical protein
VWSQRYGGLSNEVAQAIAVNRCGSELALGGTFESLVTFESAYDAGIITIDGTAAEAGSWYAPELFFARLAP